MLGPMGIIEHSNYLLNRLMKHQERCGCLEETEKGKVRCSKCGLEVTKEEAPITEGKGFRIEYY